MDEKNVPLKKNRKRLTHNLSLLLFLFLFHFFLFFSFFFILLHAECRSCTSESALFKFVHMAQVRLSTSVHAQWYIDPANLRCMYHHPVVHWLYTMPFLFYVLLPFHWTVQTRVSNAIHNWSFLHFQSIKARPEGRSCELPFRLWHLPRATKFRPARYANRYFLETWLTRTYPFRVLHLSKRLKDSLRFNFFLYNKKYNIN